MRRRRVEFFGGEGGRHSRMLQDGKDRCAGDASAQRAAAPAGTRRTAGERVSTTKSFRTGFLTRPCLLKPRGRKCRSVSSLLKFTSLRRNLSKISGKSCAA